jgi:ribose/xylose/arabinose/galactoside ABC-type transport system permease subunit
MASTTADSQPAAAQRLRILTDVGFWSSNAAPVGLAAVVIVFSLLTPAFLTSGNISDLLVAASILVVLAAGQSFPIAAGGIDLSIGATMPWAAVLLGLATKDGLGMAAGIVVALAGGALVGAVNGLVITKVGIDDFIVTLGTLGVMSGVTLLFTDGNAIPVNSRFLQQLAVGGAGPIRWFWLVALAGAACCYLVIRHTGYGTHLLAVGGNRDAARSMGISTDAVRVGAYTVSGLSAGLAGVLLVSYTAAGDPTLQTTQLLNSIAAVVLGGASLKGGKASILGATAGAVLLTALLDRFTLLQISTYYQLIATGLVVVVAASLSRLQR